MLCRKHVAQISWHQIVFETDQLDQIVMPDTDVNMKVSWTHDLNKAL